jgi:hypothetical protein
MNQPLKMDDHWPRIGILVLNQNGRHWLRSIFSSLLDENYPNKRIFLVDNASTDSSVEWTQQEYPQVTILRMPSNLGYCMAYNLARRQSFTDQCDWVIWANNDVRLEADCLSAMAQAVQTDAHTGVAGPAFLSWEKDEPNYYILGNYPEAILAMEKRSQYPRDVEWVEGSFLMVSRRCYESVGPLDPVLFFTGKKLILSGAEGGYIAFADHRICQEILGLTSQTSLEGALKKMADWAKANRGIHLTQPTPTGSIGADGRRLSSQAFGKGAAVRQRKRLSAVPVSPALGRGFGLPPVRVQDQPRQIGFPGKALTPSIPAGYAGEVGSLRIADQTTIPRGWLSQVNSPKS